MPWSREEGDKMSVTVEDLLKLPSLLGAGVAAGRSGLKKLSLIHI